jgi:hypothetical protein
MYIPGHVRQYFSDVKTEVNGFLCQIHRVNTPSPGPAFFTLLQGALQTPGLSSMASCSEDQGTLIIFLGRMPFSK